MEMVHKTPSLTFRMAQGLEVSKVKQLNVDNVASFYANLEKLYELHLTSRIIWVKNISRMWRPKVSPCKEGLTFRTLLFQKSKSGCLCSLVSILQEQTFPISTFSKGSGCVGTTLSIVKMVPPWPCNPKLGWPTNYVPIGLFILWNWWMIAQITFLISHFDQHLLILDEHNSHITLETVQQAKDVGLDLPSLPAHTSHEHLWMWVSSSHSKLHSASFKVFGI
jgi:hypothetical protein